MPVPAGSGLHEQHQTLPLMDQRPVLRHCLESSSHRDSSGRLPWFSYSWGRQGHWKWWRWGSWSSSHRRGAVTARQQLIFFFSSNLSNFSILTFKSCSSNHVLTLWCTRQGWESKGPPCHHLLLRLMLCVPISFYFLLFKCLVILKYCNFNPTINPLNPNLHPVCERMPAV